MSGLINVSYARPADNSGLELAARDGEVVVRVQARAQLLGLALLVRCHSSDGHTALLVALVLLQGQNDLHQT